MPCNVAPGEQEGGWLRHRWNLGLPSLNCIQAPLLWGTPWTGPGPWTVPYT